MLFEKFNVPIFLHFVIVYLQFLYFVIHFGICSCTDFWAEELVLSSTTLFLGGCLCQELIALQYL